MEVSYFQIMKLLTALKNKHYRKQEMVKYWMTQDGVEAKVYKSKDGHYEMQMKGEKYPFPGFPRGALLYGSLSPLKHLIKNLIFNKTWNSLDAGKSTEEIAKDIREDSQRIFNFVKEGKAKDEESNEMRPLTYDMLPPEKMVPPVQELHRVLTEIGVTGWRDIITFIFQEDDAYRFRFQWIAKFFPRNPTLKDLEKGLNMLEHAEMVSDMKERVRLVRRVILATLRDPETRKTWEEFLKECDWKKIRLTNADKYFFRAKYFKVDFPEYQY